MTQSVIYLANTAAGSSIMAIYNDSTAIQSGQQVTPDYIAAVTQPGLEIIWEGNPVATTVTNPWTFTAHVNVDAFGQPVGTQIGNATQTIFAAAPPGSPPGTTAYDAWNIYRDDGRTLYIDPVLGAVQTLYYCKDVSNSANLSG
jgi:hypothetical protein